MRPRRRRAMRVAGEAPHRREAEHHLVGQHPFREDLHARAVPLLAESGCVAVSGGLEVAIGPVVRAHEERRHRRTGGACHAGLHRRRRHGARLSDVRLSDRDRAGHGRRAGARAPVVRGRLHPVGVLASLLGDRAFAHRSQPGRLRHHTAAAAGHPVSRTTMWSSSDPTGTDHDYLGSRSAQGALQLHARHRPRCRRARVVRDAGCRVGGASMATQRRPVRCPRPPCRRT